MSEFYGRMIDRNEHCCSTNDSSISAITGRQTATAAFPTVPGLDPEIRVNPTRNVNASALLLRRSSTLNSYRLNQVRLRLELCPDRAPRTNGWEEISPHSRMPTASRSLGVSTV